MDEEAQFSAVASHSRAGGPALRERERWAGVWDGVFSWARRKGSPQEIHQNSGPQKDTFRIGRKCREHENARDRSPEGRSNEGKKSWESLKTSSSIVSSKRFAKPRVMFPMGVLL